MQTRCETAQNDIHKRRATLLSQLQLATQVYFDATVRVVLSIYLQLFTMFVPLGTSRCGPVSRVGYALITCHMANQCTKCEVSSFSRPRDILGGLKI